MSVPGFIELTDSSGKKVSISVGTIDCFEPSTVGANVYCDNQVTWSVSEDYETIKTLIWESING